MDILVLGDSFAAQDYMKESWTTFLSEKLKANVEVVAKGGQAFYYCYHYLKHCKKTYDFYIILVTSPDRLYVNQDMSFTAGVVQKENRNYYEEAATTYFTHLYNAEYARDLQILLIKGIKEKLKNKNYFLMPCFTQATFNNQFNLYDIKLKEDKTLPKELQFDERFRINHLIAENNEMLANYFCDIILKGFSTITLEDFITAPIGVENRKPQPKMIIPVV